MGFVKEKCLSCGRPMSSMTASSGVVFRCTPCNVSWSKESYKAALAQKETEYEDGVEEVLQKLPPPHSPPRRR
jgi:ribosomal protein L37AE/L43A